MKIVYAAPLIALVSSSALAGQEDEVCGHAATLARSIMEARQVGVPAEESMRVMLKATPEASRRLMREMVLSAYASPRFNTQKNIDRAVQDFADDIYVSCMGAY